MNQLPSPDGATLITPSAPMPARRSQIARTSAGSSSKVSAASGSSTKSFSVPCPLTKAMPSATSASLRRGQQHLDGVDQVAAGSVQPGDTSIAVEPGPLAPDEPAGGPNRRRYRLGSRRAALDHVQKLWITQRAGRGAALPQPTTEQRPDLGLQAGVDHPLDPLRQVRVQRRCLEVEADQQGVELRRTWSRHGG